MILQNLIQLRSLNNLNFIFPTSVFTFYCHLVDFRTLRIHVEPNEISVSFLAERYEPCSNPGAPSTAIQSTEKAFFQAGETLSFTCRKGYELQGESTVHCLPGHPSQWSSSPPMCRGIKCSLLNPQVILNNSH